MKVIDYISRFFVGGLFIFSGLVKLNDPRGTEIKLKEYFEIFAADFAGFFEVFVPIALPLALFIIILELVLGVAVLLQIKMPITTWILLLLMVFFTALTFYSAYTGKVTDCGCFGDAIPLTPWQSFYKDVILMVFVLHLFWYRKRLHSAVSQKFGLAILVSVTALSIFTGWYALEHLPYIDFRAYKVGNNIKELMQPKEAPIYEYTFVKEGEEVKSQKYLSADEGYEYVSFDVLNEDRIIPKIQDYQVFSPAGEDITEETLSGRKLILVIHDTENVDTDNIDDIKQLLDNLPENIEPLVFTAALESQFEAFRHEYQLALPYYFVDSTVLKAMIRSNPGILYIINGTVAAKWHHNDVPDSL